MITRKCTFTLRMRYILQDFPSLLNNKQYLKEKTIIPSHFLKKKNSYQV